MCLELVKAAKGKSAVDYIKSVPEPSATNKPTTAKSTTAKTMTAKSTTAKSTTAKSTTAKSTEYHNAKTAIVNPLDTGTLNAAPNKSVKRKEFNVEGKSKQTDITCNIIPFRLEIFNTVLFVSDDESELESSGTDQNIKTKKIKTTNEKENWKREIFDKFHNIEEAKYHNQSQISTLKKYNLVLRNIQLEKDLGVYLKRKIMCNLETHFFTAIVIVYNLFFPELDYATITRIRMDTDPSLNSFPVLLTQDESQETLDNSL